MNGDSLHSNRVEEDSVPECPRSPAGTWMLHVPRSTSIMVCVIFRYRKLQRCMLQSGLAFESAWRGCDHPRDLSDRQGIDIYFFSSGNRLQQRETLQHPDGWQSSSQVFSEESNILTLFWRQGACLSLALFRDPVLINFWANQWLPLSHEYCTCNLCRLRCSLVFAARVSVVVLCRWGYLHVGAGCRHSYSSCAIL